MMGKKSFQNSLLIKIIQSQKQGKPVGVYSICSANRFVIEACMLHAQRDNVPVLIEATSNQVNQFGGYTGMTPADFVAYVYKIAASINFPTENIILGGDHLGLNLWQNEPAETAMAKARDMIRDYVLAGFQKIHLDVSIHCVDDSGDKYSPCEEELVAARTADLCEVAEEAFIESKSNSHAPLYVIGTEVPIPGGVQEAKGPLTVTQAKDAECTIQISKDAFFSKNLQAAWERVIAVVVQPGVAFSDDIVFKYNRNQAQDLSSLITKYPQLVYEAHSTDYQTKQDLKDLVYDHFAILKVGPWLTFALREALFALEAMEVEWLAGKEGVTLSRLKETLETVMLVNPVNWEKYYHGSERYLAYARKYSYSDRVRYYWHQSELNKAVCNLIDNLTIYPVPLSLLSQFMPGQYQAVRAGEISNTPLNLIHYSIMEIAATYSEACGRIS